jgi:hypothetical protein
VSTRERRFQSYSQRWREGRVHRYVYDSLNKQWHCLCRPVGNDPYGRVVSDKVAVTCKLCDPSLRTDGKGE